MNGEHLMTDKLLEAMKACKFSAHYESMYESLEKPHFLTVDLDSRDLSHALFFHMAKMKLAAWRHKVVFKRGRNHSLPEIFQDLIVFYLRCALPSEYTVEVEPVVGMETEGKKKTLRPDICIRLKGHIHCVIEAKTTIGWARPDYSLEGDLAYKKLEERITLLAKACEISPKRIFYVFEEPTNVHSQKFLPHFWDKSLGERTVSERQGILGHIFPLFIGTNPAYWPGKKIDSSLDWCDVNISDAEILIRAKTSIVTPFELIVQKIIKLESAML
jgi:hypothetical protein